MSLWKSDFYQSYVSTGQSASSRLEMKADFVSPYMKSLIDKCLSEDRNLKILDLACGDGNLLIALKSEGYSNSVGVEISSQQVEIAKQWGLENIVQKDLFDFLESDDDLKFDVIFMLDILEHLDREEMIRLLHLAQNRLSANGKLVIQVPNATGIFGMNVRYGDITHEFAFTQQSISQLLSFCGFKIDQASEIKPIVHGLKSLFRRIVWNLGTLPFRLLIAAESGHFGHILSQNLLIIASSSQLMQNEG